MAMTLDGSNGVTFNDASLQGAAASPYVLKNRIINGAMVIDQRNAGASITPTNGQYLMDRWLYAGTQTSKGTVQQNAASVTPPVGFSNYLGFTSSSAYSITSTDSFSIRQYIEGYNVADLAWGTANAKTVTLSFQVYSSLTGTFGGSIVNYAGTRSYPFSYTISSANTWTSISVTIAGDTSGTWVGATNAGALDVIFGLGSGSTLSGTVNVWQTGAYIQPTSTVSVVGTNGATFYITGVQLEIGSSATPFERRMYTTELQLCQRYCPMFGPVVADSFSAVGYTISTTQGRVVFQFPVTARTAPTGITVTNATGFALAPPFARAASAVAFSESNTQYASVDVTTTGLTANQPTTLRIGSTGGCKIEFTGCEL